MTVTTFIRRKCCATSCISVVFPLPAYPVSRCVGRPSACALIISSRAVLWERVRVTINLPFPHSYLLRHFDMTYGERNLYPSPIHSRSELLKARNIRQPDILKRHIRCQLVTPETSCGHIKTTLGSRRQFVVQARREAVHFLLDNFFGAVAIRPQMTGKTSCR